MEVKRLDVAVIPWGADAERELTRAQRNLGGDVSPLRDLVAAGRGALLAVLSDGVPCCYVVLGLHGPSCRVAAASGRLPGYDLTRTVMPAIERAAAGCRAVVLQTARPGLVRKLARMGYTAIAGGFGPDQQHVIMRKALA